MKQIGTTLYLLIVLMPNISGQLFQFSDNKVKIGDILRTHSIFWDVAKTTLRSESHLFLDSLVDFMKRKPNLGIEVGVHVDSRHSDSYSFRLDNKRAESVAKYLMLKGIKKHRVVAKGYWDSHPLISDDSIKQLQTKRERSIAHQKNRRTEIKILKTD